MKKTLSSGAVLDITRSPFVIGHRLFKTVVKELKDGVDLKLGMKEGQTLGDLAGFDLSDEALNTVKDALMTILSSQEIENVIWECMPRVRYNDKQINTALFDEEDGRAAEDFFEIFKEVAIYNLLPFGKSLASVFPGGLTQKITKSLTSK